LLTKAVRLYLECLQQIEVTSFTGDQISNRVVEAARAAS
jgi:hypothetical protein